MTTSTSRNGSKIPIAVIMISLNEEHNINDVCENLKGWASEVFLVDSHSKDNTVSIALGHGVHVVQRKFRGFGDQWNFALQKLPIKSPWTMKLDPDERVTDELKEEIASHIQGNQADGMSVIRRLWFMQRPLPVKQRLVRVWRTGMCKFTDVSVNEYPIVDGALVHLRGELEHHDSPDLEHWYEKQNRYTTAEAVIAYTGSRMAAEPKLLGNQLERRMWLKKTFYKLPFRFQVFFWSQLILQGSWRAGWVGWQWARLRSDVMRMIELKTKEMKLTGKLPGKRTYGAGAPDSRVEQAD